MHAWYAIGSSFACQLASKKRPQAGLSSVLRMYTTLTLTHDMIMIMHVCAYGHELSAYDIDVTSSDIKAATQTRPRIREHTLDLALDVPRPLARFWYRSA